MARLLFDARLVLDRPTGIGQWIVALLPELARLAPDLDVHVVRRSDPWPGYGLNEMNLTQHVSTVRHMSLAQHVALPRLARRLGVDLFHYPHFDAPVGPGIRRLVATIHDVKYLARPEFFPRFGAAKRFYMRRAYARTLKRGFVMADSDATARDLKRLFPREAGRIDVVPAAADPRFGPADDTAVRELRSSRGLVRPFVLCVAEFRPHKNHKGLISAWAHSRAAATHDLVLVGQLHRDGVDPTRVAEANGVAGRVHVLTDLSYGELNAAYTAADLFVLVSKYEGFGLPLLEAMACGVPVVAAGTTAAAEVAGNAARIVDPESVDEITEAIDRVLDDEEEATRLRAAGLARAREFSWEATARGVIDVYRRALEITA